MTRCRHLSAHGGGRGRGRAGSRDPDQAPPPKGLPAPVALDLGLVGGSFAVFADCLII